MIHNTDVTEPTPEMASLLLYLCTRSGPIHLRPAQRQIAETCNPKWIAFGFGNVAQITEEGRKVAQGFGDNAHKNKITTSAREEGLQRAQKIVNEIVKRMVAAHYPVECTHKAGHKEDYIPCDSFGGWIDKIDPFSNSATYFESNLARVLIGGWHSKTALIQLMIEMRRYTQEQNS